MEKLGSVIRQHPVTTPGQKLVDVTATAVGTAAAVGGGYLLGVGFLGGAAAGGTAATGEVGALTAAPALAGAAAPMLAIGDVGMVTTAPAVASTVATTASTGAATTATTAATGAATTAGVAATVKKIAVGGGVVAAMARAIDEEVKNNPHANRGTSDARHTSVMEGVRRGGKDFPNISGGLGNTTSPVSGGRGYTSP